jgi:hypothetical protein
MFSIAPQFVPYAFAQCLGTYVAEPLLELITILGAKIFYIGESLKFQNFFFMNKKEANCVKKILNLEGRHSDLIKMNHIRVIRKVRKTEHQNPEFGHIQGEIKKKPAKSTLAFNKGMKLRKPLNWW